MHRVSGIYGQLCLNDIHIANSQSEGDKEQMQASPTTGEIVDTPFGPYHRCLGINSPCNPSSPPALSRPPSTKDRRASPPPLIRVGGDTAEAECTGFDILEAKRSNWQGPRICMIRRNVDESSFHSELSCFLRDSRSASTFKMHGRCSADRKILLSRLQFQICVVISISFLKWVPPIRLM